MLRKTRVGFYIPKNLTFGSAKKPMMSLLDFSSPTGLQSSQDARFYATSARFEPFSNEGKPLVIQFTIKHEQKIDCGGGYVKVFPADLNQADMNGDSQYYIMFGASSVTLDLL